MHIAKEYFLIFNLEIIFIIYLKIMFIMQLLHVTKLFNRKFANPK